MENLGLDELIVDEDKVSLVETHRERFERDFRVQLEFGLKATDGVTAKQWICLQGYQEDRNYAKNYIRALCNAEEHIYVSYPVELHSILTNPKIQTRLEKQSKTAITFDSDAIGQACIYGMDSLAVALASSAVEDLIVKYSEENGEEIQQSPNALQASSRLDTELKRMRSQDKDILYDDDYTKMPAAVKRSILNWYMEDATTSTSGEGESKSEQNEYDKIVKQSAVVSEPVNSVTDQLQMFQLSPSWDLCDVGYLAKPSDFQSPPSRLPAVTTQTTQSLMSLPQDNSLLRETGLTHGYSEKDVDAVLTAANGPMRTSEFLKALVASKKAKEKVATLSGPQTNSLQENNHLATSAAVGSVDKRSDSPAKHPMQDFITRNSPVLASSSRDASQSHAPPGGGDNQSAAAAEAPTSFVDYFARLSQDFQEEEGDVTLDALKKNSQVRQKLLADALTGQAAKKAQEENQEGEEEDISDEPDDEADAGQGWAASGAKPKQNKQGGKKRRRNKTPAQQQDKEKAGWQAVLEENAAFKQPASPTKKRGNSNHGNQNQNNMATPTRQQNNRQSPLNRRHGNGGGNGTQNRSPSPSKQWKHRQSPYQGAPPSPLDDLAGAAQNQSATQKQFDLLRQQHEPYWQRQQHVQQQPWTQQYQPRQPPPEQMNHAPYRQQQQQHPRGSVPRPFNQGQWKPRKRNLRYVVIDGSNVAMAHGNQQIFSCRGIQLCIDYFVSRGHTEVTAFVPQWRRRRITNPGYEISDQDLLEELREQGYLTFTPARRVPGKKNIVPYDDKFVLRLAEETEGIIVSNDNYRDLWHEKPEWRHIIEERLLCFSFVKDLFMPPEDPLGRDGPTLDDFLQKDEDDLLETAKPTISIFNNHRQRNNVVGLLGGGVTGGGGEEHANPWQMAVPPNTNIPPPLLLPNPPGVYGGKGGGGGGRHSPGGAAMGKQQQQQRGNNGPGNNTRRPDHQGASNIPNNNARNNHQRQQLRTRDETARFATELEKVFPDPDTKDKIKRILENHPSEMDLNKLSGLVLEVM